MAIVIAAVAETRDGEQRVAMTPDSVKRLRKAGFDVLLQRGAGAAAGFPDGAYADVRWAASAAEALSTADIVLAVRPTAEVAEQMRADSVLIGMLAPHADDALIKALMRQNVTGFALELLPRSTRAQAMDVLSSQANLAGYKAALIAAGVSTRIFPMMTTAAGTVRPAKVLVIGAGVAGLQAIATARRLGAQVEGFDVRPEVREQIESLGAKFLDLGVSAAGTGGYARELSADERMEQQRRLGEHLARVDAVITTAAIPGRPAPKIITAEMVSGMKAGAVIVDLAAETGGNCELTQCGERVEHNGVTIVGPTDIASTAAYHASELYARNLINFVDVIVADGALNLDFDDELVSGACVVHQGAIVHDGTRHRLAGEIA